MSDLTDQQAAQLCGELLTEGVKIETIKKHVAIIADIIRQDERVQCSKRITEYTESIDKGTAVMLCIMG